MTDTERRLLQKIHKREIGILTLKDMANPTLEALWRAGYIKLSMDLTHAGRLAVNER